eukprot:TRINITY_DN41455_c0_g1_i2.p1 TRINITY_DN41455_c0_g1~~TRINITY_DN41455_c0_g1_i2.p1  ORF type:complete len:566 (+),score=174.34 TRINITY_DN41455_c0_g1_i2:111-1808(+)
MAAEEVQTEERVDEEVNGKSAEQQSEGDNVKEKGKKSPFVMALLHMKWASFLQKACQPEKAAGHYQQALDLIPSARAYFGLGCCLASLRQRQEAVDAFKAALKICPDTAGAHVNLAGVLLAMGKYEDAVQHCHLALKLEPGSREAVMNLANALRNLGKRQEAIDLVWTWIAKTEKQAAEKQAAASEVAAQAAAEAAAVERALENAMAEQAAAAKAYPGTPVGSGEGCRSQLDEAAEELLERARLHRSAAVAAQSRAPPTPLQCHYWSPSTPSASSTAPAETPPLAVVCVKWGKRYDAAYVNRLFDGVCRQLPSYECLPPSCSSALPASKASGKAFRFICFTDDSGGLHESVEARDLPSGLSLWWGKAYLFSEAAGLEGHRVLFLDLDQVMVGSLEALAGYRGPFALLGTDDIACELADGGYNSSVMAWEASPFFRPIYDRLGASVLKYVHRFDHWLEMNVADADLWQSILPGHVVDYTACFRGGVCLGSASEEAAAASEEAAFGAFADAQQEDVADREAPSKAARAEVPEGAAIITFPRNPKPHEVVERHVWVRRHWLGQEATEE